MSLGSAVTGLLSDIEKAYNNAIKNGSQEDNSETTIETLANDLADAVIVYFLSAVVSTDVTIDSGQKDTVGGSTTNEGQGTGTGFLENGEPEDLKRALTRALRSAVATGQTSNPIPQLAQDVGTAIHEYMISPDVITSVTTPGGQSSTASAGTAVPTATVSSPGTGAGKGEVIFVGGDVDSLISALETAYETAKVSGETSSSLENLAFDIHTAIDSFALTAIIETNVDIFPGQVLAQYMVLVGTAPAPLPATTTQGTGTGEGTIS